MTTIPTGVKKNLLRSLSVAPEGFDRTCLMPQPLTRCPSRISSLALDISGRCNLACRYCAESATQPKNRPPMEPGQLKDIRLFMLKQGQELASFRLGSGEPMLNKPLLHELQRLIEPGFPVSGARRPEVFITTNGTLIEKDDIDWLAASGWNVKISIDGPASVHDRWRVFPGGNGTHSRISGIVRVLAEKMPEKFSVTAVLAAGSDPEKVFGALASLGVRRIELVPAVHEDPAIPPQNEDIERYGEFIDRYVERAIASETGLPQLVRFSNRVARIMGYDNSYVQCGAGRNFVGVGPEGEFYPCFRFIGVKAYRMGSIAAGLDSRLADSFRKGPARPWSERNTCTKCWAAPLCGGPCFAVTELFGPGEGEPLPLQCAFTLIESHGAWRLFDTLQKQSPEKLLAYLPSALRNHEKAYRTGQTT